MNYERLYTYRFRDINQGSRAGVWQEISPYIHRALGSPDAVLDPAAGRGEFISAVPAKERWAVDMAAYDEATYGAGTTVITSEIMKADLPAGHFGGTFVSNFLEHLHSQEDISAFLEKMLAVTKPGGRIAIMGPNYRYCSKEYWDFADHIIALTHMAIAEHLYTAGFEPERVVPRFLPYSFTGILPPSRRLTALYLRTPIAWRLLGKQFLVIGRKPS